MVTGQKLAANPTDLETRGIDVIVTFPGNRLLAGDLQTPSGLEAAAAEFHGDARIRLLQNVQDVALGSVNAALNEAIDRGRDVILLDSDTIVSPGVFSELQAVSRLDAMIGFVSPRSNYSTISGLPHQERFRGLSSDQAGALFEELSRHLPRFQFVPVGAGCCLYLKHEVLREFGVFDKTYQSGYEAHNDLILRANRCGYRAALANWAFVYHAGDPPEQETDFRSLSARYPEYLPSLQRYFDSARYKAEALLAGLVPDREGCLDLLFDCSTLGAYHNGTSTFCRQVLSRAATLWRGFHVSVLISEEARKFHAFDEIEGVAFVGQQTDRQFAVAFRPAQPFAHEQMALLSRLAPINVYAMLDPIAADCQYLNSQYADDLEKLWGSVFSHSDGVIFISDFASQLFRHRYAFRRGIHELVAYPSTDLDDYRSDGENSPSTDEHILVIGNQFEHKRVLVTVRAIQDAFPNERIVVVGVEVPGNERMVSYQSGYLSERKMHQLFQHARFVVFPSVYEGFGFPAMESLARKKPIIARSLPLFRDLREKVNEEANFLLYSSTQDLIRCLQVGFPRWHESSKNHRNGVEGWDRSVLRMGDFIETVVASFDFEQVLLPRIEHMSLRERIPANVHRKQLERKIQDIYTSWSWKVTSPLRWIGSQYLRFRRR